MKIDKKQGRILVKIFSALYIEKIKIIIEYLLYILAFY